MTASFTPLLSYQRHESFSGLFLFRNDHSQNIFLTIKQHVNGWSVNGAPFESRSRRCATVYDGLYSPNQSPEKILFKRAKDQANKLVIDAIFVTLGKTIGK